MKKSLKEVIKNRSDMRGGCNLSRKKSSGLPARTSSRTPSAPSEIARTSTGKQTRSTSTGKQGQSQSPETNGTQKSGSPLGGNQSANSRTHASGSRGPSPVSHTQALHRTPETNGTNEGSSHTVTLEPEQQTTRRVRGLTQGVSKPEKEKERMLVTVKKNTLMQAKARAKIQPIMRKFYNTFYKTWAAWPELEKDALWDHFLIYFRFRSPKQEALGRKAWDDFTDANYPKWLFRWKEAALKKHGSIEVAKDNPPEWAKDDAWEKLCTHWMSEEFKEASDLRKRNRAAGVVIPHTSGSTPYVVLRDKMEKEIGRPLTQYEDFRLVHTQKVKGTNEKRIISKEAEQILDNYATKLREKHGDSEVPISELEDQGLEIYKEVVGGVKKGHLLGRPREKWSARKKASFPPQFEEQESTREVKKLRTELEQRDKVIACLSDTLTMVCEKMGIPPPTIETMGNASNPVASNLESHEEDNDMESHEEEDDMESHEEDDEDDGDMESQEDEDDTEGTI